MEKKYVVIIQCEIARQRCSGFACTNSFYEKLHAFVDYDENTRYLATTCGGCSGKGISARLENFAKRSKLDEKSVSIHLASCITNDNKHSPRCPHVNFIRELLEKKGFTNIVEGSYFSKTAKVRREQGIYKTYEE